MMEISLLGCGWLGMPLAQKLVADGFSVKGSTTSEPKTTPMLQAGIVPFIISLSDDAVTGNISEFLASEILIIDIPPKKTDGSFAEKIKRLLPHIENSSVRKVLFVSSISVYGEASGIVDESTIANPDSANGRELCTAEELLLENLSFETTVVRFGGLIGPDRHPVKYLSGRQNDDPDAPVNLIHLDDCIGIIKTIIALDKWGEIYNAVAPFHPTRRQYYTKKAADMNLPLPTFTDGGREGKSVRADKVINELAYTFGKPFL